MIILPPIAIGKIAAKTVIIGSKGVEKVVEINLNKKELENFKTSIKAVEDLFLAAIKIDPDLAN